MEKHTRVLLATGFLLLSVNQKAGADPLDYLVIGATGDTNGYLENVRSTIQNTGILGGDIYSFNAFLGTPSINYFYNFDAILVFTLNPFQTEYKDLMGDMLADYSFHGGGVVQATFSFIPSNNDLNNPDFGMGGDYRDSGYEAFLPGEIGGGG